MRMGAIPAYAVALGYVDSLSPLHGEIAVPGLGGATAPPRTGRS
jgi:hypothetical protein